MTIAAAQTIRRLGLVEPLMNKTISHGMSYGLGPAAYDVRVAETKWLWPKTGRLFSIMERIQIPPGMAERVHDKSTWARRFVTIQNTLIQPGWKGFLTLELTNHSWRPVCIRAGMPIAQIVFEFLDEETEIPYGGKYQDQSPGACPARQE